MPPRKLPLAGAPLKSQYFLVLLAVAEAPAHGYAIKQDVERRGGGRLDPGSLYRVIARLLDDALIDEARETPRSSTDPRRRYYIITDRGRRTLSAEAERMASLVDSVRKLAPDQGPRD